jgi:hypothetical protein
VTWKRTEIRTRRWHRLVRPAKGLTGAGKPISFSLDRKIRVFEHYFADKHHYKRQSYQISVQTLKIITNCAMGAFKGDACK